MKIVHVSSEIAHLAKVGGLGDVVYGLVKKQRQLGLDVKVLLPFYCFIQKKKLENLIKKETYAFDEKTSYEVWSCLLENIPLELIKIRDPGHSLERDSIYGGSDESARFLLFSTICAHYLKSQNEERILHLHDWPASYIAPLSKCHEIQGKIVLTMHNVQYQGKCLRSDLKRGVLELGPEILDSLIEGKETVNLLKGGILYADALTTVSPTYAEEILTREFGCGLEKILKERKSKLTGILNGIDESYWNPCSDPFLPYHLPLYADQEHLGKWKSSMRKDLEKEIGLKFSPGKLLCVVISRLVEQKGPELMLEGMSYVIKKGGQFVLLGSGHDLELLDKFARMREELNHAGSCLCVHEYNEALAHHLFAAADAVLIPSLFEPCGLTQMIALRYGALPIVRKIGGLADTVFDVEDVKVPYEKRNGFVFDAPTSKSLIQALERTFHCFEESKELWLKLVKHGRAMHFNWDIAAQRYLKIYKKNISAWSKPF